MTSKNNRSLNVRKLTQAGMIAALYVALTMLAWGFNLASGAIQVRFSEALTVLPFLTPYAIPGLTLGCLLANFLMGSPLPDIIFGTLATFLGAIGTYSLRNHRWLCAFPPVLSNAIIIPFVLSYAYHIPGSIPYFMLTVGAGELIACVLGGQLLLQIIIPVWNRMSQTEE